MALSDTTFDPMSMLTTAAQLYDGECLILKVPVEQNTFDFDDLAFGIAFLVGLIVGSLVAVLCAYWCFRHKSQGQSTDPEDARYTKDNMEAYNDTTQLVAEEHVTPQKKGKKKRGLSGRKASPNEDEEELLGDIKPVVVSAVTDNVQDNKQDEPGQSKLWDRGLVHVLLMKGPGAGEEEVAAQDMEAVSQLEKELKEESIMSLLQALRALLLQQLQKGKVGKAEAQEIMQDIQQSVQEEMQAALQEKNNRLRAIGKSIKDPDELQAEQEKTHSNYLLRLGQIFPKQKEALRKLLAKKTQMTEADIDALLSQYDNNMAHMEHKLGEERARQAANLEERLQRRRLQAATADHSHGLEEQEVSRRKELSDALLQNLAETGQMTDRQRDELLNQHSDDLDRVAKKHRDEYDQQKLRLAEKLKQSREKRQRTLAEKQEAERDAFHSKTDKSTDSKDLLTKYHALQQKQRDEREELSNELDDEEVEQLNNLQKVSIEQQTEALDEREEEFHRKLASLANLSEVDLDRIIQIHNQEMDEWERTKRDEKKRMKAKLAERMAQRQKRLEAEELQTVAEQETIRAEQDLTVNKLISSKIELSDDAKEKLLREHDQNMTSLNNNLQMSKLRQNKALEAKLAKRKAKVEELKQQQEDLKNTKKNMKQKEREKKEQQLAAEIEALEQGMESERARGREAVRERLAAETAAALAEQERAIGASLARLEVGQARRQAIIAKQDKTIKNLEEQIAQKVSDGGGDGGEDASAQVDYLLKDHYNQVTALEEQLQDVKARQQQQLKEKLQAKQLRKQREVENKLEEQAATEWEVNKQRGVGLATSILGQAMLEQRHRAAVAELEKEMSAEMQRQMDQLHAELQHELQQELDEQKKSFLAQVAAISQLSKAEVNELVEDAVAETGGSEKQAKKLAKEMRQEMQRAKTSLNGGTEDPYNNLKRTGTGYGFENQGYEQERPKSSKRARPKSAFKE